MSFGGDGVCAAFADGTGGSGDDAAVAFAGDDGWGGCAPTWLATFAGSTLTNSVRMVPTTYIISMKDTSIFRQKNSSFGLVMVFVFNYSF